MIHPLHPLHSWFLWLAPLFFLLVYGLPLLIMPMGWAQAFGWQLPGERRLTAYLGRCLGGVAVALVLAAWRAAPDPAHHPIIFELMMALGVLLAAVHLHGAVTHSQPWLEDAETLLYALLAGAAWYLQRTL